MHDSHVETVAATRIGIAVVEHNGRYLVGTRGPGGPLGGMSEFPGGKCLPGERPQQCAERECREETGLSVCCVELLLRQPFHYPHGFVDLHFFRCRTAEESAMQPLDHGFRWVPAGELASLKFPAANAPLIEMLGDKVRRTPQSVDS